ncbi:hypothetical protein DICPUDRAFT_88934 [Dictyostelium purpureum]|uniref:Uncharacterized protein n=1 Tax=Dictyostelium purpureum TaxID=5786 RepID=F0ZSM0_DICPU|nr:uncharacterized protein DICPUDRAFT_88934 [Dictyostelium purpureum]EGC33058.1 hypothetical protein DICPUDRAFT_88934 [Dictyostelium purpureum]|eukprot:XP_003290408.1 hypothetical protein DICPUDRAFT_88934 [Dictyostelium purpureum]
MTHLNFIPVYSIFKILSTSLGPKGLDKVIVNIEESTLFTQNENYNQNFDINDLIITNDGATIMKNLPIKHPLGIILKQLSNSIDVQVGDGTTSGVILACKLLEESEKLLIKNYHPNLIIKSYQIAYDQCKKILNLNCIELNIPSIFIYNEKEFNNAENNDIKILKQIISTSLSSKILSNYIEQFTKFCFQAVSYIQDPSSTLIFNNIQNNIKYNKILGNNIASTKLIRGIIIKLRLDNINIMELNNSSFNSNNSVNNNFKTMLINFDIGFIDENTLKLIKYNNLNFNKIEMIENEKKQLEIKQATDFISNLKNQNKEDEPIIIFSSKRISLSCLKLFKDNNIKIIYNLSDEEILNIQKVTFSPIVINTITSTIHSSYFGTCKINQTIEKQSEFYLEILNDQSNVCTFLLKAPSVFIIEEIQRSLNDSISILSLIIENKKIISGGGSNELQLSSGLEKFIKSNEFNQLVVDESKQDIFKIMNCIKSFARALQIIPILLINNAGFDSLVLFEHLKIIHKEQISKDYNYTSINLNSGKISNMLELGVIESLKGKETILKMIIDTVSMIIKIDQMIK